ncbi:hypothetical protein ANCDUO_17032 [Ancylostoma duodenale]|uniref:Uncharacterized protein n=1 Tax=Ancylostoma duodenale TaxID=51022 RepID=A0A0C2C9B0_9BILA|nr:hypothetical protein ANCDUO_17032 [Ancylostoma duodenale]
MIPIILLGLVTLTSGQQVESCDSTRFNHCNQGLQQYWDIDTSNVWNDISLLNQAFITLLRPPYGINNYVNVCNGLANFYSCLGPKNVFNCLGLVGLVGNNKSPQDAYAYMGLLADWRFKCGAGFFAVYESTSFTSCTQSTYVNYNNDMNKIVNDYKKNITADTSNACKYAQNLMDSYGTIYRNGACRATNAADAQWYGCQSGREYTNAQFKHCQHFTKC